MRTRFVILIIALAAACGGDGKSKDIDAAQGTGDAAPDGTPGIDAATDATGAQPDAAIGAACGMTTCTGTDECCVGAGGSTCVAAGTCQTTAFACDGPEDCEPNQVCCFGGGGAGGTECKLAAQCQSNACHTNDDCSGNTPMCCPIGQTQYSACLAQCPP